MLMTIENHMIPLPKLALVARAEDMPGTQVPLLIGDWVMLNSGSPLLLVTDVDGNIVHAATSDGAEHQFERQCLIFIGRDGGESASPSV
jgi:hypothetical protein